MNSRPRGWEINLIELDMDEIWKDIEESEGVYQVSSLGRVRSTDRTVIRQNGRKQIIYGTIIKQQTNERDYKYVSLRLNKKKTVKLVHRLVAKAFIQNPYNYPQVNHKDENPSNNNVNNLEWCTAKYNMNYGTCMSRAHAYFVKKVAQYKKDGSIVKIYDSSNNAAISINGNRSAIQHVCQGRSKTSGGFVWKYVTS